MGRTSQKDLSTLVTIYEAGESLEIRMDQGVSRPESSGDQSRDVDESGLKTWKISSCYIRSTPGSFNHDGEDPSGSSGMEAHMAGVSYYSN